MKIISRPREGREKELPVEDYYRLCRIFNNNAALQNFFLERPGFRVDVLVVDGTCLELNPAICFIYAAFYESPSHH